MRLPDQLLLGGGTTSVGVLDGDTGARLALFGTGSSQVISVSFLPAQDRLITGHIDGTARVWNLRSSFVPVTLEKRGAPVEVVRLSGDGKLLVTAGRDQVANLWSLGEEVPKLIAGPLRHDGFILNAEFSRNNQLLLTVGGSSIRLWRTSDLQGPGKSLMPIAEFKAENVQFTTAHFSQDARRVLGAGTDGSWRVWDVGSTSMPLVSEKNSSPARLQEANFCDDQNWVYTVAGKVARIWSLTGGNSFSDLNYNALAVTTGFKPSEMLLGTSDGHIKISDLRGTLKDTFAVSNNAVTCLLKVGMNSVVVGDGDGVIKLWDRSQRRILAEFAKHSTAVRYLALSKDQTLLASGGSDGSVKLWLTKSGQQLAELIGHSSAISAIQFFPNATRLVTASYDGTVQLWRLQDPSLSDRHESVSALVRAKIPFHLDGDEILAGSTCSSSLLYSARGELLAQGRSEVDAQNLESLGIAAEQARKLYNEQNKKFAALQLLAKSQIKGYSWSAFDYLWRKMTTALQDVQEIRLAHRERIQCFAVSPDRLECVTGSTDGSLALWDLSASEIWRTKPANSWVLSATFTQGGKRLVATYSDGDVVMRDASNGNEIWKSNRSIALDQERKDGKISEKLVNKTRIWYSGIDPLGRFVYTAGRDGVIRIWETERGRLLRSLGPLESEPTVALSADGRALAAVTGEGTLTVWDTDSGNTRFVKQHAHAGQISSVTFYPTGQSLVTGGDDGFVRIWDISKAKCTNAWSELKNVSFLSFAPDQSVLLVARDDGIIHLYDTRSLNGPSPPPTAIEMSSHAGYFEDVEFSSDSTRIVTSNWDHTIRVWETRMGRLLGIVEGPWGNTNVRFASGDQKLVAADDQFLWVWKTPNRPDSYKSPNMRVNGVPLALFGQTFASPHLVTADGQNLQVIDLGTGGILDRARYDPVLRPILPIPVASLKILLSLSDVTSLAIGGKSTAEDSQKAANLILEELRSAFGTVAGLTLDVRSAPGGSNQISENEGCATLLIDIGKLGEKGGIPGIFATLKESKESAIWQQFYRIADGGIKPALDALERDLLELPRDLLAAGSASGTAILASTSGAVFRLEHNSIKKLATLDKPIHSLAISNDGKEIAVGVGDLGEIRILSGDGSLVWQTRVAGRNTTQSISFDSSGRRIAVGYESGVLEIFDVDSKRSVNFVAAHTAPIRIVRFSTRGERLVSCDAKGMMKLWNASNLTLVSAFAQTGKSETLNFLESDNLLLSAQGNMFLLWDCRTGKCVDHFYSNSANCVLADQYTNSGFLGIDEAGLIQTFRLPNSVDFSQALLNVITQE